MEIHVKWRGEAGKPGAMEVHAHRNAKRAWETFQVVPRPVESKKKPSWYMGVFRQEDAGGPLVEVDRFLEHRCASYQEYERWLAENVEEIVVAGRPYWPPSAPRQLDAAAASRRMLADYEEELASQDR